MQSSAAFNKNLHGLRGLLALGVVVGHCDIADVSSVSVWFFFVLSGYLFSRIYAEGMRLNQLGAYAVRRVARLVPLYAVVLIAIALVPEGFYDSVLHQSEAVKFKAIADTVFEHLTFRRGNIHFWTLSQEMVGYILIAALMLMRARMNIVVFVVLCVAVAIASDFVWIPMASDDGERPFYAFHFIVGVLVALVPIGKPKRWASMGALGILAVIFVAGLYGSYLKDPPLIPYWHVAIPAKWWGVIGGVVVLGLAHGTNVLERLAFFGTISYGLYVFHFLAILVIAGLVEPPVTPAQMLFAVSVIIIPLSWLSYRFIEGPCIDLAHRLTRRARPDVVTAAGN